MAGALRQKAVMPPPLLHADRAICRSLGMPRFGNGSRVSAQSDAARHPVGDPKRGIEKARAVSYAGQVAAMP